MVQYHSFRNGVGFGKVNDPRPNVIVVIDHEDTAADDLVRPEVRRLLKLSPYLPQSRQKPLPRVFARAEEQCHRVENLFSRSHLLEVSDGRAAAELHGVDAEAVAAR